LDIGSDMYRSIGIRPIINARGTFTIITRLADGTRGKTVIPSARNLLMTLSMSFMPAFMRRRNLSAGAPADVTILGGDPVFGNLIPPLADLGIEIGQIGERSPQPDVLAHITEGPLDSQGART